MQARTPADPLPQSAALALCRARAFLHAEQVVHGGSARLPLAALLRRIYWTALGAGPDYLNGLDWKNGGLATMKLYGKPVGQSAWATFPLNQRVLIAPASTAAARPGDLVFFGYGSSKHVRSR